MGINIRQMPSTLTGLYSSGKEFHYTINLKIEMTEDIDGEVLAHAVEKTRMRYPYYFIRLVFLENGEIEVEENPASVIVRKIGPSLLLMSEESNYHIQMFEYEGRTLFFRIHHGFTDGRSLIKYMQTVMYLYVSEKYGIAPESPGVRLPGEKIPDAETEDPMLKLFEEVKNLPEKEEAAEAVAADGRKWDKKYMENRGATAYFLTVPEDSFVKYSKDVDSSPATLPLVFMQKAVRSLHEEPLPIFVAAIADSKPFLHCEEFMGYCVQVTMLPLPEKTRDWTIEKTATAIRAAVILQTQEKVMKEKSLEEARLVYKAITGKKEIKKEPLHNYYVQEFDDTTMIIGSTYPGPIRWGDLNQYITSFYAFLDTRNNMSDFLISVFAINGQFCITVNQRFTSDIYVKQFAKELEKEGISCTVSEIYSIEPTRTIEL